VVRGSSSLASNTDDLVLGTHDTRIRVWSVSFMGPEHREYERRVRLDGVWRGRLGKGQFFTCLVPLMMPK
jgi:hypothetical protein